MKKKTKRRKSTMKLFKKSQALWLISVIPALRRLRQEDCTIKPTIGYISRQKEQHQTRNNFLKSP
jgi:hypothetical protein